MIRSYLIPVYPNQGKLENIRYTITRFTQFVQHFTNKFYYNQVSKYSTKGMGTLANQAQRRGSQQVKSHKAATKVTGTKSSCPEIKFKSCPARIELSEDSSYDYWISVETQFPNSRNDRILIPANSIKPLNKALKRGWKLNETCELIFKGSKYPKLYARVFVEKEETKVTPSKGFLGVDVGINHDVARSDGYLGPSAREILNRSKEKRAEQSRQIALKEIPEIKAALKKDGLETRNYTLSKAKTAQHSSLKQQLGIDVSRSIARCLRDSLSLVVENPKVLANLKTHNKWARCYFASRATIRAREEGIRVIYVNPAYSSQTCSKCGVIDRWSRVKQAFRCTACGYVAHADLNAACILAQRASVMQYNKGA